MNRKNLFAPRPPMGWNGRDCFGGDVNEEQILQNAQIVAERLRRLGWEYIVVDIRRYQPAMDGKGFSLLAEAVHAMGLKFGVHMMCGAPQQAVHCESSIPGRTETARDIAQPNSLCQLNTDCRGEKECDAGQAYYDSIFRLYSDWGVDFVKVDGIADTEFLPGNPDSARREIERIRTAIDRCGREIVLSLSPGPAPVEEARYLARNANMWGMGGEMRDNWGQVKALFPLCEQWASYVGDGCWPDCGMLPIGHLMTAAPGEGHSTALTQEEQRTLFALLCMFRSPLMMGGDLTRSDEFAFSLLTNEAATRINRTGGVPMQLFRDEEGAAWLNHDEEGRIYLALFNLSDEERDLSVDSGESFSSATDVWTGETRREHGKALFRTLPPHGCAFLMLE